MTHNTANASSHRLLSLDAYRGFVILMMIWVNYIAEMPNLPAWLKHATAAQDTFTLPDLVFPGFLFMAGMAIPLALRRRMQRPSSLRPVLMKILWRSFSLVVAGVMMVNAYRYDAGQALLPRPLYYTLFYLTMILLWQEGEKPDAPFWVGAALMIFLVAVFRGQINEEFSSTWLQGSWWGILGMIGWAYLCCSLAYVVTRGDGMALMGIFALMIALYMGDRHGALASLPAWLTDRIGIGELFGSTAANMLAGTLVGNILCRNSRIEAGDEAGMHRFHLRNIRFMCWFAFGMIVAALLLRPYHGINKIAATESYTLICAGINLVAFIVFYIVIEVFKRRAWTVVLVPLGINALLAYILPDVWDQLMALIGADRLWFAVAWPFLDSGGIPGLLNAALISIFMLMLAVGANRMGLRLKF